MTLFPRSNLPETDPAARWLEHYEAVEKQRSTLGAIHRRHPFPPGLRRRRRAVAMLIALAVVLAGAAAALLWL
jgi:hypothetical protein